MSSDHERSIRREDNNILINSLDNEVTSILIRCSEMVVVA